MRRWHVAKFIASHLPRFKAVSKSEHS